MLQRNCGTQFLQQRGICRSMCMIQLGRLQSQVFYCNEAKRNICPWTLQSSIYEGERAREEVCQEERGVCVQSCAQSWGQPRPAHHNHCGGLALSSLGKHGAHHSQDLVRYFILTEALSSQAMPNVHVVIFPPALFLVGAFVSRYWHRQRINQPIVILHCTFSAASGVFSCPCCCNTLSAMADSARSSVLGQVDDAPLTLPFSCL